MLFDQFQNEAGAAVGNGNHVHLLPGAGQGDIEKPPLFRHRIRLRLRHCQLQHRIVYDSTGEARRAAHHPGQDHMIRLQTLGPVHSQEPNFKNALKVGP